VERVAARRGHGVIGLLLVAGCLLAPVRAIAASTSIWSWGDNEFGVLGDGTYQPSLVPKLVTMPVAIVQIAAGDDFVLALDVNGEVWSWGVHERGSLGRGGFVLLHASTPGKVAGLDQVVQISASQGRSNNGGYHALALRADGTVWSWGDNEFGKLGRGTPGDFDPYAAPIPGLANVTKVAAGGEFNLALRADGSVWAWGRNQYRQLGDGTTTDSTTPVRATDFDDVVDLGAGVFFASVLRSDGTVWGWGANNTAQLGIGYGGSPEFPPVQAEGLAGVVDIEANGYSTIAIDAAGDVWTWGASTYYNAPEPMTPWRLGGGHDARAAQIAGVQTTLVVKRDGTVWSGAAWTPEVEDDGSVTFEQFSEDPLWLKRIPGFTAAEAAVSAGQSLTVLGGSWKAPDPSRERPVPPVAGDATKRTEQDVPDPFVMEVDGRYYAFGTNTRVDLPRGGSAFANVPVFTSSDLVEWTYLHDALPTIDDPGSGWQAGAFSSFTWAPAVLLTQTPLADVYQLFFTGRRIATGRQCIGVASAADPEGPYTLAPNPLLCNEVPAPHTDGGAIDASPFVDENGRRYLLWKNDCLGVGCSVTLWAQELSDTAQLVGSPSPLLRFTAPADATAYPWEPPLIEGPAMVRRGSRYHLFYSANRWDFASYAIGWALCETPLGPCGRQTAAAPWLRSYGPYRGPGGQELVRDRFGRTLEPTTLVYHAWDQEDFPVPDGLHAPGSRRHLHVWPLDWQEPACGLGVELPLVLAPLMALRRRRRKLARAG